MALGASSGGLRYTMMQESQLSEQPLLTIAIPTYNRNKQLHQTLSELLPQVTQRCEVLIIDNASSSPVAETTEHLLAQYPNVQVRMLCNRANIGGNANICRCVEMADGQYLWILSDDDHVLPNALHIVLTTLENAQEAVFINYSSEIHMRKAESVCIGINSFIDRIDSFANILFTSTSIFRTDILRDNLSFAYHYSYTMAPHIVALLLSLGSSRSSVLSCKQIVKWTPPSSEHQWPQVPQALGMLALLELPLSSTARRRLAKKLIAACTPMKILTLQLLKQEIASGERANSLFYYDHISYRLTYFGSNPYQRLRFSLYRLLLCFPLASTRLLKITSKCLGRPDIKMLDTIQTLERL